MFVWKLHDLKWREIRFSGKDFIFLQVIRYLVWAALTI
jgi:hypothetical protein